MKNIRGWLRQRPVFGSLRTPVRGGDERKQMAMVTSLTSLLATFALIPERGPGEISKITFAKAGVPDSVIEAMLDKK